MCYMFVYMYSFCIPVYFPLSLIILSLPRQIMKFINMIIIQILSQGCWPSKQFIAWLKKTIMIISYLGSLKSSLFFWSNAPHKIYALWRDAPTSQTLAAGHLHTFCSFICFISVSVLNFCSHSSCLKIGNDQNLDCRMGVLQSSTDVC
jgi:hypothetical protein